MPEVAVKNGESQREREKSFRDLLSELASISAALVRDEIALAKQEIAERIDSLRPPLIAMATGSVLGVVALMALAGAAIGGLALVIGPALASLCIGVGLAIIAGVVFLAGLRLLKKTNLRPEETIRTLKEDAKWLKQMK
jgi:hypothetical protein